ncbi:MAG: hypothetical protein O7E57_05450 [Gammaproteobacteria bacterium]|nr:hypothetical protein [Gammaproteobacteria bacterium]
MSNDNTEGSDADFEKRAQKVLRAGANDLPPEVNERLVAMRRGAVQELEARSSQRWQTRWFWAPVGVTAAVALALGLFLFSGDTPIPMFDDLDEVQFAATRDMEMLEELEFLAWMEEEARNAG